MERTKLKRLLPTLCALCCCAVAVSQEPPHSGNSLPLSAAEARFQQGLRLAAANKADAAIKMFSGLTLDYPLLPQPYVQLAALYVQQGKLSRAIDSLQAAVDRKLDDGALQEKLGDLYLELAKQSYRGATDAVNPGPGAADKFAALQKLGLRPMTKGPNLP